MGINAPPAVKLAADEKHMVFSWMLAWIIQQQGLPIYS